ncbi:peptidase MA family metallohydrolase [Desulfococcus sp.]|uniref:peptidase MA family metallohydrolase n=1 Tax=Desulfococcus sp. TaxID=2025834 RepID=UPI0035948590
MILLAVWGYPFTAGGDAYQRSDGPDVTVFSPPALAVSADEILRMVPRLKQDLVDRFNRPFPGHVTIWLLNDARLFAQMIGRPYFSAFVRPEAGAMVIDNTKMHHAPLTLETTLKHELCHLMLHRWIPASQLHRWLDEGVAQWYSDGFSELLAAGGGEALRRAVLSNNIPSFEDVNGYFSQDRPSVILAYEASRSIVDHMVRQYGVEGLLAFLGALGDGASPDAALYAAAGVSLGEFEAGWRKALAKTDAWWVIGSIHFYEILFFTAAVITCIAFLRLMAKKKRYADDEDPDQLEETAGEEEDPGGG